MKNTKISLSYRKCAPLSSSRYSPYGRMRDIRGAIKNFAAPIPRIETLRGDEARGSGFTLIELLVVVLIIGILAAVAVPQYQVAVEKSKTAAGWNIVKTFTQAQEAYKLQNGTYARNFDELALEIPSQTPSYTCSLNFAFSSNMRQIGDWGVVLDRNVFEEVSSPAMAVRLDGKFKCYALFLHDGQPYCATESNKHTGKFCKKLGATSYTSKGTWYYYKL